MPVTEKTAPACAPAFNKAMKKEELLKKVTQLKALAHPVRLRMVEMIQACGGEVCVCEFEKQFEIKQPTISHHLKILREAGLVHTRREGKQIFYSLNQDAVAVCCGMLMQNFAPGRIDVVPIEQIGVTE